MASKKIVLNAAGTAVTVTDATAGDIVSTLFDTDAVVTGAYGYVQKAGLAVAGLMFGNQRHTGNFFKFKSTTKRF